MTRNIDKPKWKIVIATEKDVEKTLEYLANHMNESSRLVFQDKLERYTRKPDRDLILAVQDDRILGLACVIDESELPPNFTYTGNYTLKDFAYNTQLLVHPDYRKYGIGSSLQNHCLQWSKERGHSGHWLITHRMADWYTKHFDYEEIGRIKMKGTEKVVMVKKFLKESD